MPSFICTACGQQVYMVDELRCMDRIWHKNCFRCNTCKRILTVNNYRPFDKLPYCEQHCPDLKPTAVADMATRHAMETAKFLSQVQYRKVYEATKGDKTSVADDIETRWALQATRYTSPAAYRGGAERKQAMDLERQKILAGGFASPPRQEQQSTSGEMPSPQGVSSSEGRPMPAEADPAMQMLIQKLLRIRIDDTNMPIVLLADDEARPTTHRYANASTSGMLCIEDAAPSGVPEEQPCRSTGAAEAGLIAAEPNVSASSRRSVSSGGSSVRSRKSAGKSQTGAGRNAKVQRQLQLANHSNSVEIKQAPKEGQPAPGCHRQQDDCYRCLGPVSPQSRVDYRNKTWHRKCFMCQSCGSAFCAALRLERAVPTCVDSSLEARLRSTVGRGAPDIADELQILREVDRALAALDLKQVVRSLDAAETSGALHGAALEPPSGLQPATADSNDRRMPKQGARATSDKAPSFVSGASRVGDVRAAVGRPTGSARPGAGKVRALGRPSPARPPSSNSTAKARLQATSGARRQPFGGAAARSMTPRGAAAGSPRTPYKTTGVATSTASRRALAATATRIVGDEAAAARGRAAKPSTPKVTVDGDRSAKPPAGSSAKPPSRTAAPIPRPGVKPAKPAATAAVTAIAADNAEAISVVVGDEASRQVATPARKTMAALGPAPSSASRAAAASARRVTGVLARSVASATPKRMQPPRHAKGLALSRVAPRATPVKTRAPQPAASVGRLNTPGETPVKRLPSRTPSTPFRTPAARKDIGRPGATPTSSLTSATDAAQRLCGEAATTVDKRDSNEATLGTCHDSPLLDITNLGAHIHAMGDVGDRFLNSKLFDKVLPTIVECSQESGSLSSSAASLGGLEMCPVVPTMVTLVDMQGQYPSFVKGDLVGRIKPAGGGFVVGTVLRTGERGFIKALHLADPMDLL